ncbi:MAG: Transmembrane CAAX amino protease family protein [uncultured bacterium]|nr:MAG: Transmembrane CAAX amino protease family protein [uncultured bacterium]
MFKIKDILRVFSGALVLLVAVQFFLKKIPYFANMEEGDVSGFNFLLLYVIQILIFLIPLLLVVWLRGNISREDFGFKKIKFKDILKFAAIGYASYFIIAMAIAQIGYSWGIEIPGFQQQESHIPLTGERAGSAITVITIITFLGPIMEEVFFRGFLFNTMLKHWPVKLSFLLSALIFAAIHLEFRSMIPLFLIGLVLNWMFYRTKSLYPGIFFHIINNAIALGLEYYIYLHPEVIGMV